MSSDTAVALRQELKSWEQAFATTHGRKPSREDIKNDVHIAQRYKLFNRARRPQIHGSAAPSTPQKVREHREAVLEERNANAQISTPRKPRTDTPHKDLPAWREQVIVPTPMHIRCALGPTPHKDGHILGLFDDLPSNHAHSPTKDATTASATVISTPSRPDGQDSSAIKLSRTPRSSSKRFYLDAFAGTPMKRKREEEEDADIGTPSSTKNTFATPAFLRRDCSFDSTFPENATEPSNKNKRKRGLVRSLSTLIAGLRQTEEERMDEEWEIMQEMEEPSNGVSKGHDAAASDVQVEDSQMPEMPLGPDEAFGEDDDSSEAEQVTARKPWKKKGLKRQTKRVNMKPVLHAPQKATESTQQAEDAGESHDGDADPKPGLVKKALRKVNEAAHMNFRRLKIKSKNSKASGRGRFGRR